MSTIFAEMLTIMNSVLRPWVPSEHDRKTFIGNLMVDGKATIYRFEFAEACVVKQKLQRFACIDCEIDKSDYMGMYDITYWDVIVTNSFHKKD